MRVNPLVVSTLIQAGLYLACVSSDRYVLAAAAAAGALVNLIFLRIMERANG